MGDNSRILDPTGGGHGENLHARIRVVERDPRRVIFCVELVLLPIATILLIIQQVQFGGTWNEASEFQAKVWSTVALSYYVLNFSIRTCEYAILIKYGIRIRMLLWDLFKVSLHFFHLAWILFGIQVIFVESPSSSAARVWAITIWWISFITAVVPFLFFCGLLLCIGCFLRLEEVGPVVNPTPAIIKEKLKIIKYQQVKKEIDNLGVDPIDLEKGKDEITNSQTESSGKITQITDIASAVGVPIADISLRNFPAYFQKSGSGNLVRDTSMPSATVVGRPKKDLPACPICFSEFVDDDDVVEMPCDRRHLFHQVCLLAWLENSQNCPVCRRNLVDLLQ